MGTPTSIRTLTFPFSPHTGYEMMNGHVQSMEWYDTYIHLKNKREKNEEYEMTCSDMALQNTDTTAEWSMHLYNIVYYPDRNTCINRTIIFTNMHETI